MTDTQAVIAGDRGATLANDALADKEAELVAFPPATDSLGQDEEWCVVRIGKKWTQVRFHDYEKLFSIPGLYEKVIYESLNCRSPQVLTDMLCSAMQKEGQSPADLRVLDLGAGNGIVAECLADRGAKFLVGLDIIEAARQAADRDRPGLYERYFVADASDFTPDEQRALIDCRFNCLMCVAALGFGDIPTDAFIGAFNQVQKGGWIAFNIKDQFLEQGDDSGFAGLVRAMCKSGTLDVRTKKTYTHRLGTDLQPLEYVGIVGQKTRDI